MSDGFDNVKSVFHVPKAVGRVYIEAPADISIQRLCHGLQFVYSTSVFSVPVAERVALLVPGALSPLIVHGQLVKIRNGLYKGDIGEVVDAYGDGKMHLVVKIKSREKLPFEVKRKKSRRVPYILDRDRILQEQLLYSKQDPKSNPLGFKDRGRNGISLGGIRYTDDGFLLLNIRADRVERVQREGGSFESIVSDESRQIVDRHMKTILKSFSLQPLPQSPILASPFETSRFPLEKFIRAGDPVQIAGGHFTGARGYVVELLSAHSALVRIGVGDLATRHSVLIETERSSLARTFEIGDRVEVKVGELKGLTGFVSAKVDDKLNVVDPWVSTEVCILT